MDSSLVPRGVLARGVLIRGVLARGVRAVLWLAMAWVMAWATASLARLVRHSFLTNRLLKRAALRDPLTGLANRTMLMHRLDAALDADASTGQQVGVLFCDLDGFKQVNEKHGHAAGDFLLTATAMRIASAVRPTDTVARQGGDEFVVLCPGLPPSASEAADALDAIAERIRQAVSEPVSIGAAGFAGATGFTSAASFAGASEETFALTISIGCAITTGAGTTGAGTTDAGTAGADTTGAGTTDAGTAGADTTGAGTTGAGTTGGKTTSDWLLRQADLDMYRSKNHTKAGMC